MVDPWTFLCPYLDAPEVYFPATARYWLAVEAWDGLLAAGFLIPAGDAENIACPWCPSAHVEEVVRWDQPDGSSRLFIPCPESFRLELTPDMVRRWTIGLTAVTQALAKGLALGGACTELETGRLWRLGRAKWKGVARDVLFVRGLGWSDGARVASLVARATRPIVCVGDQQPPPALWPGRTPPVISLMSVAALRDDGLEFDHDALIAAIIEAETGAEAPVQQPLAPAQLKLMIRQQIKAEEKTQLTDDILVAAYQQEGSVRKAAAFLTERTQQTVTKDKVQSALRRCGGVRAVISAKSRGKLESEPRTRRLM